MPYFLTTVMRRAHAHVGDKARAAARLAARLQIVARRSDALEAALLWFDAHHPGTLDSFVLSKVRCYAHTP